jgi:hypothetical protein
MSAVGTSLSLIGDDLKKSNYFRIYAVLWVLLVVTWLVGLGMLADRAVKSGNHPYLRLYNDDEPEVQFPSFRLRLGDPESIDNKTISCLFMNNPLPIVACSPGQPTSQCFAVDTNKVYAQLGGANPDGQFTSAGASARIDCQFNAKASEASGSELMAFEFMNNAFTDGANSYASTWILPNNATWIMISESVINNVPYWDRSVLYHAGGFNTPDTKGDLFYTAVAIMDTNNVLHMSSYDYFEGWQAVADMGGLAFMFYILHTVVMTLVGLFLENNSNFLRGGRYAEYETLTPGSTL